MSDDTLNLLDFGTNDKGEYVNLVEEEKKLKDISKQELTNWVNNHDDPLIRIADFCFCGYEYDNELYNDVKQRLENIVESKCYHYGNLGKGLYIFSLIDKRDGRFVFVFENNKHYLVHTYCGFYFDEKRNVVDYTIDDYLVGKAKFSFAALYCPCFDTNGKHLAQYNDREYQKDIRHIVCIKEWEMNKFSENRMEKGKKIKDFYECEFALPNLIDYWGESSVEKCQE